MLLPTQENSDIRVLRHKPNLCSENVSLHLCPLAKKQINVINTHCNIKLLALKKKQSSTEKKICLYSSFRLVRFFHFILSTKGQKSFFLLLDIFLASLFTARACKDFPVKFDLSSHHYQDRAGGEVTHGLLSFSLLFWTSRFQT